MNELQRYFKDRGISVKEAAQKAGYSTTSLTNLLNGSDKMNDRARFRLTRAFPDIVPFLESVPNDAIERVSNFDYLKQIIEDLKAHPTDTCVEWRLASESGDGYGRVWTGKKLVTTHRLAFELYHGHPATQLVLHRCDCPQCINPAHLYDGTPADNGRDRRERGLSNFALAKQISKRNGNGKRARAR